MSADVVVAPAVQAGAAPGRGSRGRARALAVARRDVLTGLVALAVGAVVWELVSLLVPLDWLPRFSEVMASTGDLLQDPAFRAALVESTVYVLEGYLLSAVIGIVIGAAMGLVPLVDRALRYYLDLALFVPPIVMAPVFLIVLGLSRTTLLAIIVVFASTVIAVNTRTAVAGTDEQLRDVARSFGADRRTVLTRVVLPGALPLVFVGLHLGIARAVKGMIIGQLFLAVIGLGAYSARFERAFDAVGTWSVAVLVIALSLVLSWVVKVADVVVNDWAYRAAGARDE